MTRPDDAGGFDPEAYLQAYRDGLTNIDIRLASGELTDEERDNTVAYRAEIKTSMNAAIALHEQQSQPAG